MTKTTDFVVSAQSNDYADKNKPQREAGSKRKEARGKTKKEGVSAVNPSNDVE